MKNLPVDLQEFLARGEQLQFDAKRSYVGKIQLKSLADVSETVLNVFPGAQSLNAPDPYESLPGTYEIVVCDLVADSEDYRPEGILCWLPRLSCYGTIDAEHGDIITFPKVSWSHIVKRPLRYLDAQWNQADSFPHIYPWLHFPFALDDSAARFDPYPPKCPRHNGLLVTHTVFPPRLLDITRAIHWEDWLEQSKANFPCRGVPISHSKFRGCKTCIEAEANWLDTKIAETPTVDATTNDAGYIKCPRCGRSFSVRDDNMFYCQFHMKCGQRINVVAP